MKIFMPVLWFLLFFSLPVLAENDSQPVAENDLIRVSAERLEADDASRSVVFTGKVKARQAGMVVYADKMTLYYSADEAKEAKEVDRVEIDGKLRIVQDDRIATADRGIFLNRQGRVLLSGHAEVHQAGNSVVGDEIVYYLNESRSVVKSQPDSRVNAVFHPGRKP